VEASCKLDPKKDFASCAGKMVSAKETSYVTDTLTGYSSLILPVTITAGADKLAEGGAGTTSADGTASATASPTGAATTLSTATVTDTVTNSQATGTSSETTAPASSSTSTGGVPRITQNAVVLGAAALVGGAMFM
jgi:hypothetical protein